MTIKLEELLGGLYFGIDVDIGVGCGGSGCVGADTVWQPTWEGC